MSMTRETWIPKPLGMEGDLDNWRKKMKTLAPAPKLEDIVPFGSIKYDEYEELISYKCIGFDSKGEPRWQRGVLVRQFTKDEKATPLTDALLKKLHNAEQITRQEGELILSFNHTPEYKKRISMELIFGSLSEASVKEVTSLIDKIPRRMMEKKFLDHSYRKSKFSDEFM